MMTERTWADRAVPLDSLFGIPVHVSEYLEPGQWMIAQDGAIVGGGTLHVHPTLNYAMNATRGDLNAMSDPAVMILASMCWQEDVIARKADRAVQRLDDIMAEQDKRRAQRAADDEMRRKLAVTTTWVHRGRRHRWTRDMLRRTAQCSACELTITEEMAHRLGEDLGDDYGPEPLVPPAITEMVAEALARAYRNNQRWLDMLEDDTQVWGGETVTFPRTREDGVR